MAKNQEVERKWILFFVKTETNIGPNVNSFLYTNYFSNYLVIHSNKGYYFSLLYYDNFFFLSTVFSIYQHIIILIKTLSSLIHFYVILFPLDLKTTCFRYIDYASMLFPMLCDTLECWFNLSSSWTR